MPKVLVYGWYGHGNLGDELFIDCFKKLFPSLEFIFTDHIMASHLQNVDAVFFGGGSFLMAPPKIPSELVPLLKKIKIFYIGIGVETQIHPLHQEFLKIAQLIAIRSSSKVEQIKKINDKVIVIPDLVYSLITSPNLNKIKNSILVIPNIVVVPKWNDPQWKHSSWQYFKSEFCQLLDEYCQNNCKLSFLPFCINSQDNDQFAAIEIINGMRYGRAHQLLIKNNNINEVINTISQYEITISQRYHGTILSHLSQTRCLTIHHHDKLKNVEGNKISYFGLNKSAVHEEINKTKDILPIDRNIFKGLVQAILNLII